MWLFAQRGFLSIVQDRNNPDKLLVRARVKGDIEKYFPNATILRTEENDYLYRAFVPRDEVVNAMIAVVNNIKYTNFKANIEDVRRHPTYYGVWNLLNEMQWEFELVEEKE